MRIRSLGNVHGPLARTVMAVLLLACLAIQWLSVRQLARSPDLGGQIRSTNLFAHLAAVEPGSRLEQAGFHVGDTVLEVNGRKVDRSAFLEDRDRAETWAERDSSDAWRNFLSQPSPVGSLRLIAKGRVEHSGIIALQPLGWARAIERSWAMSLVGWIFFLNAWLIWRRHHGQVGVVNLFGGIGVCLALTTTATLYGFDYVYPWGAASALLLGVNFLASQSMLTTLHMVQIFPTPLLLSRRHPVLLALPWLLLVLVCAAHFTRFFPGPFITAYVLGPGALLTSLAILLVRFRIATDPVEYRQLQWIALGGSAAFLPWLLLSVLPNALGAEGLPQQATLLAVIILPVCISFAVARYRLLDVGQIFDGVIVHTVTILVLAMGEFAFWSWFGDQFAPADPVVLGASMAVLAFFYAPLRQVLSNRIDRMVGKKRPSSDEALHQLLQRMGESQAPLFALEATLQWALPLRDWTWKPLPPNLEIPRCGALGSELGLVGPDAGAIWITAACGPTRTGLVLHTHRTTGWSRPDLDLVATLVRATEPLCQIETMRREHAQREAALHDQRSSILREMHDGIGSQLFGLSMLSQLDPNTPSEILRDRLQTIHATIRETQETLRTGLVVMDAPPGAFGPALVALLLRAESVLSSARITLQPQISEAVASLRMASRNTFGLLRSVQEALTNVTRHAQADQVWVTAQIENDRLIISIEDNGIGIQMTSGTGHGLTNIRQRLQDLKGTMTVHSPLPHGTRIRLEVPLEP